MNARLLIAWFALTSLCAPAQGMVRFDNRVPAWPDPAPIIDAPFYDDGGVRLAGTNYVVALYAGRREDALLPVTVQVPFQSNGYFYGGDVTIWSINAGDSVWVQARSWATECATFEEAVDSGCWTGLSQVLYIPRAGTYGAPAELVGLRFPGPPTIIREPQSLTVRLGESANLSVVAVSGAPQRYQWFNSGRGNTNGLISGATNSTYASPPLVRNTEFWVRISNVAGTVDSQTAFVTSVPAPNGPLDDWTLRKSLNRYHGVAFGNAAWVVVGSDGIIEVSRGGTRTTRMSGTSVSLNAVTFGASMFVVVGDAGVVLTSGDIYSWTNQGQISEQNLRAVCWANGVFAAVGDGGTILLSEDAVEWTAAVSGVTNALRGICHGNGTFVAVGESGTVLSSTNGTNWRAQSVSPHLDIHGVAFGDGDFVAVGADGFLLRSTDGLTWIRHSSGTSASLYGVARMKGMFVAVGERGTDVSSTNGVNWAAREIWEATLQAVTANDIYMMAVGERGTIIHGAVWNSIPNWSLHSRSSAGAARIAYGEGTFVAIGGQVLTSETGANWVSRHLGTDATLNEVCYGQRMFVAVGSIMPFQIRYASIYTSEDGLMWESQNAIGLEPLKAVTFGNGTFVAVGESGAIVTSTNGIQWVRRNSSTSAYFTAVAYGNGKFVAVSRTSAATSPDGITWNAYDPGIRLTRITFGDGLFVAVDVYGTIFTSPTGEVWSSTASGTGQGITAVAYGNGTYVAVGRTVLSSTNGSDWISHPVEGGSLQAVTYGRRSFVAVGNVILQSRSMAPVLQASTSPNQDGLIVTVHGSPEPGDRLQGSTDLIGWEDLCIFSNTQLTFLDTSATNRPKRFYRLIPR